MNRSSPFTRFTEGYETADLKAAKELLASFAARAENSDSLSADASQVEYNVSNPHSGAHDMSKERNSSRETKKPAASTQKEKKAAKKAKKDAKKNLRD